jgi:glycine cleavage system H protein
MKKCLSCVPCAGFMQVLIFLSICCAVQEKLSAAQVSSNYTAPKKVIHPMGRKGIPNGEAKIGRLSGQVEASIMADNPNDIIKVTVDKFIFTFPTDVRYGEIGLWIKKEDGLARIGLSDFAQQRNGDIAFANLPDVGSVLEAGEEIASIETVKVNISLPSPMKGTVVAVNSILQDSPEFINQDPYGKGWMVVLKVEGLEQEIGKLLDAEAYAQIARQQADAELKS